MNNVITLAVAQALSASGMMTLILIGGILGSQLAQSPELATLPIALMVVGMAAATIPATSLMRRFGRRPAFRCSALLATAMALLACFAVVRADFVLLCIASLLLGTNMAVQQQYRFAAVECVTLERASQAVSTIMVGTLAAAVVGPQLVLAFKDLVPGHEYAGSFVIVALLCLATAFTLRFYSPPAMASAAGTGTGRGIAAIAFQRRYLMALLAGVVAYSTMSFVMTATPISMHVHDHHSDSATAFVIQSHLLAMFAPSLFSGRLIARIGTHKAMIAGLLLNAACIIVDRSGTGVIHYWAGLVLLGVGWNLLFVAATAMLTTTYAPAERFKAQGLNDFTVFGTQAAASLLAGPAIHLLGWRMLNLIAVAPLVLLAVLLAWGDPSQPRVPRFVR